MPTSPRCSRTSAPAARPRSTSSPARSSARRRSTTFRCRCTRPCTAWSRPGSPHDVVTRTLWREGEGLRIAVIGCGAVGSLFAANLGTLDDVEVWAYDPWQAHVDAINANGLRLSGAGDVVGKVNATADPAALPPCELGIVAVKSMQTSEAIAATAHAFGAVCSVQNGAGNEELIAEHVTEVIRGTT